MPVIYWGSDGVNGAIGIAKLNGRVIDHGYLSYLDELDDFTAAAPHGIAVDANHLYWTVDHHVGRARVDGSGWTVN